jgi:hypothetical protein
MKRSLAWNIRRPPVQQQHEPGSCVFPANIDKEVDAVSCKTCLVSSGVGDGFAVDVAPTFASAATREGAGFAAAASAHCSREPSWEPATVAPPLLPRRPPKPATGVDLCRQDHRADETLLLAAAGKVSSSLHITTRFQRPSRNTS